jgi:hypothetical protein
MIIRGDHFWFGSVFIKKKVTKLKFKKKTETGSGSVRFFGQNRFKPVWLGFFRFQVYKTETELNRSVFLKF